MTRNIQPLDLQHTLQPNNVGAGFFIFRGPATLTPL